MTTLVWWKVSGIDLFFKIVLNSPTRPIEFLTFFSLARKEARPADGDCVIFSELYFCGTVRQCCMKVPCLLRPRFRTLLCTSIDQGTDMRCESV